MNETNKKEYVENVGKILVKDYGKKKFYSPKEVKKSSSKVESNIDWHCWAMCIFTSPNDFNQYHTDIGEVCNYESMKTSMMSIMTDGASESWLDFDIDFSWLEWPDFDFPDIFDIFN